MGYRPDIFCDSAVFTAAGTGHIVWKDVEESDYQDYRKVLHIYYEGNTPDAAADGSLLWTILYFSCKGD